jgi:Cu/Ag efflux pump CusA
VIGGLIFATCATLLLVPTIFSLVHGHQNAKSDQADAPPSPSY